MRWLRGRVEAQGEQGFTLIELLVVVGILAVLAAIAAPRITEVINRSKEARARADMKVISGAIERYYSDTGHYPDKLADLRTAKYVKFDVDFKNGWGKTYYYAVNDASGSKAAAYILADPGSKPGTDLDVAATSATDPTPKSIPEGSQPANAAPAWKTPAAGGTAITIKYNGTTIDGTKWAAANGAQSIGFECAQAAPFTISNGPGCGGGMITD